MFKIISILYPYHFNQGSVDYILYNVYGDLLLLLPYKSIILDKILILKSLFSYTQQFSRSRGNECQLIVNI